MPRRRLDEITVRAVKRSDRKFFVLRWEDPKTGKTRERATKTTRRREAEREAGKLAAKILDETENQRIGWNVFRRRYEDEKLSMGRPASLSAWRTAANHYEDKMHPKSLLDVDAGSLSMFVAKLRKLELAGSSIRSYVREITVGLNWAATIWQDYTPPRIRMGKAMKRKAMRGRPITGEEFERMLKHVAPVVGEEHAASWKFYLRGLWLSGLRLGESLNLYWDRDDAISIHGIDRRRPMLRIHAEDEKGGQDRLLPITPDFVAFLRKVPEDQRTGPVFSPTLSRGRIRSTSTASHKISDIGGIEQAAVVVDTKDTNDGPAKQFATAHDLRRSFGERWAVRVMPIILKELMRHESIETTMKYYVGINAERTANEVWLAFGDHSGDKAKTPDPAEEEVEP